MEEWTKKFLNYTEMLRIKKLGSNCNRSSIQCFFIQSSSWNGTMDKLPKKLSFLLLTLKASESSKNSMQYENTKCFSKVFCFFYKPWFSTLLCHWVCKGKFLAMET